MTPSVSRILLDRFGIAAHPGAKVECPFCHHETFSLKRDDRLGKCFHPSCGRFLTPNGTDQSPQRSFARVLEQFFHDSHAGLLALKTGRQRNAYTYLVAERGIHPRVVADSMLGAVPTRKYDLDAVFKPAIDEAQRAIQEEASRRAGQKVRPKRPYVSTPEDWLGFLLEAQEKLKECLKGRAGWLAFFYTDAAHHIVAIRFRQPYAKHFVFFKPYKHVAGLFGHGLFTIGGADDLPELQDQLMVTEGEFNQLQLASLVVRHAEAGGKEPQYPLVCAIGGVGNADYMTIRKVDRSPLVCYDHDASNAGFALVEKARELMTVTAFTTPEPDTDLDAFLRSFGKDTHSALTAFKALLVSRQVYPRHYQPVAAEVVTTRQKQGPYDLRREFEVNAEAAEIIRADLRDRGRFYHDSIRAYFLSAADKKLIGLDLDNREYVVLLARYGINRSETIFRYLWEALRIEAFERGTRSEVYRLSYYNPGTFTVYLFNQDNQIYRIAPDLIELVDNGTDGVLFVADSNVEPFQLCALDDSDSWLDRIIMANINFAADRLTADERRLIFILWFFALFFASIMRTRPILAFIGPKGAGKSVTNRKVGMLLFGERFDVTPLPDESKDFDAAVTNAAYVAIDNADTRCEWLNDRLATVATGGVIKKRELYTTNTLVEIPARCFLAITSRTPHFHRDDVADRLLIMKVKRFESFRSEKALLAEVIQNRDRLMSEVIHHLQEIVRALRDGRDADDSGIFRMADFADFSMKVARAAGVENELQEIFRKLNQEQSSFTLEHDNLFDLLWKWATKNPSREITNTDLCKELSELAEASGAKFAYQGKPRAFAQRMSHLRSNLEDFFVITERHAGGHKKLFTLTPKREEQDGGNQSTT
jgi:hypothetical protein